MQGVQHGRDLRGTFEGLVNNRGTISGGTFKSRVENYQGGVISGGMFNAGATVSNLEGSITGGVFTDAIMENGDGTITGGVFRDFTMNSKTGELTITREVDLDWNLALDPLTIGVNEVKSITVAVTGRFDAGSGSGVSVPVTNNGWINDGAFSNAVTNNAGSRINGGTFSGAVTNNMNGKITGGTFSSTVTNGEDGEISGGTFNNKTVVNNRGSITDGDFRGATVNNDGTATVTGGTFDNFTMNSETGELTITGNVDLSENPDALAPLTIGLEAVKEITVEKNATFDAGENTISAAITNDGAITGGTIDGEIRANTGTITGCAFGPNATVTRNEGIIELSITVDGRDRKVNYGADVLDALGMSPTGLWYRENEDSTRSPVKEGETFASLQTEDVYFENPHAQAEDRDRLYNINETFSVTLTEEEVPEGVDVTDLDIDFALWGQEYTISTGMYGLSCSWYLGQIGASWGIDLPSFEDTTLEVYYTLPVTNGDGEVVGTVYGESVEWVVPARPDINVTNIQPGYNEMDITFETIPYGIESYVAYLQSASDPEIVIYDDADGVVDGHIEGLTEGTEYIVHFRVPPTEDTFGSFPYSLAATHTTLTRTHLSVNAAAGVVGVAARLQPERGGLLRGAGHLAGREGDAGKGQIHSHRHQGRPGGSLPAHRAGHLYHHRQPFGGRGGRLCAGQRELYRLPSCKTQHPDEQPGHHRAAHSGADVHGRAHLSGGVRVAWSNPARDGRGLYRQLPEQREGGRGDDCHHRHGRLRGHAAGVLRYRAAPSNGGRRKAVGRQW